MANCSKCGRDVGCGCNLVNSVCMSCYNATLDPSVPQQRSTARRDHNLTLKEPTTPTEFETILGSPNMTKQEKLRRINEIIDKATLNIT